VNARPHGHVGDRKSFVNGREVERDLNGGFFTRAQFRHISILGLVLEAPESGAGGVRISCTAAR
jgi:hypothetical protein